MFGRCGVALHEISDHFTFAFTNTLQKYQGMLRACAGVAEMELATIAAARINFTFFISFASPFSGGREFGYARLSLPCVLLRNGADAGPQTPRRSGSALK